MELEVLSLVSLLFHTNWCKKIGQIIFLDSSALLRALFRKNSGNFGVALMRPKRARPLQLNVTRGSREQSSRNVTRRPHSLVTSTWTSFFRERQPCLLMCVQSSPRRSTLRSRTMRSNDGGVFWENSDRLESLLREVSHKASFPRSRARQAASGARRTTAAAITMSYPSRLFSTKRESIPLRERAHEGDPRRVLAEQQRTNSRCRKATNDIFFSK